MRFCLLIAVALVARAQDASIITPFSSNAVYPRLPKLARIQGEVTVLMSQEAGFKASPNGHPLLVFGVQPDTDHWKQWAATGMERVTYVFRFDPDTPIFVTTRVQVPRSRLARLIPWVTKTKTEERREQRRRA